MAGQGLIADNRKARFDYFIDETLEAGVALVGTEVKAMRAGRADISEAFGRVQSGELWLVNAHVDEYSAGNRFNHEPRRLRKLLLHKRELQKWIGAVQRRGVTIVPLRMYFNDAGKVKVLLGLVRGKKNHDKRATIKERDWQRDKARLMRQHG